MSRSSDTFKNGFRVFKLERYMAKHEFTAANLLCASDCEPFTLQELLSLADDDSLKRWKHLSLAYTDSAGLPELRQEIAKQYQHITPDDCLVAVPEEAIFLSMKAILNPGDHVIATYPSYQSLYENGRAIGCNMSYWMPSKGHEGQLSFQLEDLEQLFTSNTKLVVVNFPHNPTGFLPTQEAWQAFHSLCRQRGVRVFSDEMYRHLEHEPGLTLPSAADMAPDAVILGGMSKSMALPGIRIGWLATRDKALMHEVRGMKDFTTICASAPSEVLALMALRSHDKILRRNLDIIHHNLMVLDDFFARHADTFEWQRPHAGSIGFARLKADENVEAFCERCVADAGVLLAPDSMFDLDGTAGSNSFRVGFGRANLPKCIQHLETYLASTTKES